jgi:tetratricopeptide (TPR) repeat protein
LLGDVLRYIRWDWEAAEREYRRGIEMAPNDVGVRRKYWALLASLGRFDEAIGQLEIARRLDPLSAAIPTDLSYQALYTGDFVRAEEEAKRALSLDPKLPWPHAVLWHLYHLSGGPEEERDRSLAMWVAGAGFPMEAEEFSAEAESANYQARLLKLARALEARSKTERVAVGLGGALLVAAGDLDAAERWLLRAYTERSPEMVWMNQDVSWKDLRSRPAIARLIDELRLRPR